MRHSTLSPAHTQERMDIEKEILAKAAAKKAARLAAQQKGQ